MEGIQVSVEKTGTQKDISVIKVGGYIDTTTSAELERALDSLLKSGVFRVIIDLKNVDYISSAGWGIFISEIKGIRERGGDLKLANMIPDVYEVFELLEFHYILKAYDSVESAIKDFNRTEGARTQVEEEEENITVEEEPVVASVSEDAETAEEDEEIPAELEEKIRKIALENPSWSHGQIAKELNTDLYGYVKVGKLTVWKLLRKMHLNSQKQREAIAGRRSV
jgi:anti-sigma B factor antagonist